MFAWSQRAAMAAAFVLGLAATAEAASVARESVASGVRKVTIIDDNGQSRTYFEKCDSAAGGWFEARFDDASNSWKFTENGDAERRQKSIQIRALHREWEREDRRSGD